ncbi:hypothetical protein Hypma_012958 [Hypsizygus marmoreus]|uniref:Uncharacterized protein n=1 Tax=Hypsizygus marmoreus TaxID=39966 RepID=A0A369JDG6_HYPMA|nr:hypothetical protein Hypma_012958 [Hypsizygus marmoreus]
MPVNTFINEPFVLSTYGTSTQLSKLASGSKKQRSTASIFASHEKASGSSDGYATITAQADGIHVLDVSTLHPVISHTLGPSTTFSCAAVTRNTVQGTDQICTTYAAIETSSDIGEDESGRTIWMWRENLSGPLEDRAAQKKRSALISHQISGLYTCDDLPSRLLAESSTADLTILDADLNVKNTWTQSQETQGIIRSFVFRGSSCSFLPSASAPSRAAIVVLVAASTNSTHVQVMSVDETDNFLGLGECSIPLKPDQISDLSCSSSGYMSLITHDGTWHSYLLESADTNDIQASVISEPFRLKGISLSKAQNSAEVSLLSLGSSHVLLSALTNSPTPEIVLLLWDLQYSVLLASQTLPVPSTLSQSKDVTIKMTLVPATSSQALFVLSSQTSSSTRKSQAPPSRSSILVVPFSCPETSTIANAMGQVSASARWMEPVTSDSAPLPVPSDDPARTKMLATMQAAMEKNLPQAANVAFFEWEKRESKAKSAARGGNGVLETNQTTLPALSYSFVKDLLLTVVQPSKPANTPYSSEIVRYLLNRHVISGNMIEGGLLAALRFKNDWQSIELALSNVLDLSEAEILDCLYSVVVKHRQNDIASLNDADAMQVDTVSDLPSLPAFLSLCVTYSTSPPALRLAIRNSLKEAEDILAVLNVLADWITKWSKREVKLLPSKKDMSKNEAGIPVLNTREVNRDLPPLKSVLAFLETVLDASFLTLLQHPPAHHLLRSIHSQLEPEIAYIDDIEQLRAPFESFAKAHTKAIQEAGQDNKKKPLGDWRQRRKQAHEQAGLSIGLYQLEELVL